MSTGNKRISQLVELTSLEVMPNDLLLVVDITAKETKKMQFSQFQSWLESLAGTVTLAHTASYISGSGVDGMVYSSFNAVSSSTSLFSNNSNLSVSSSNALTASYALTTGNGISGSSDSSSFLIYTGDPNGTASFSINSLNSDVSSNTLFLVYTGANNGTSSYSMKADNVDHSVTADTASYVAGITTVQTSSYSLVSELAKAISGDIVASSSSYLTYSPDNGTASYAIVAASVSNRFAQYGMFLPISQAGSASIIDNLNVSSSLGTPQQTMIEAFGTARLTYTSSILNSGSLDLILLNRLTGDSQTLDSTKVIYNMSKFSSDIHSGSMSVPFNLVGQYPLYGDYFMVVTSSFKNLVLDTDRNVRFKISSYSDTVSVSSAQYPEFYISSFSPQYITFSTITNPGPLYDYLPGLLHSGSSTIKTIDVSNANAEINAIYYTWRCLNLTNLNCSNNILLTNLDYKFPDTMSFLYCSNCNLVNIHDLSNTNIIDFDCSSNQLTSLPTVPSTLLRIDCSDNLLTSLPLFPTSSTVIIANNNDITSISYIPSSLITGSFNGCNLSTSPIFPNTVKKMSLNNMSTLSTLAPLNDSMSYLDVSNCSLSLLPDMSISMSYLNISNNTFLPITQVENCTTQLVANAFISGTFIATGYGSPAGNPTILSNLNTLSSSGWQILYDGYP